MKLDIPMPAIITRKPDGSTLIEPLRPVPAPLPLDVEYDAGAEGGAMMRVVLPWPPSQLTPNAKRRSHWRRYQPIAKQYRMACAAITKVARIGIIAGEVPVAMMIRFVPPDRRRRDDDGMIGAFKAGRDGVADALGIDDHGFRPTYEFAEPEKPGRVEVEFHDSFKSFGSLARGIVQRCAEGMEDA